MSFFSGLLSALPGAVAQGLIWGLMAIGVFITFKVLDLADLTVDGTMATGGAVCIVMMTHGANVWVAMLCAFLAGMLAGLITGILHTCMCIPAILAGILTQLALFSINLRIMDKKANVAINPDNYKLLVSLRNVKKLTIENPIFVAAVFTIVVIALLYWFFGTALGCSIRATGANPNMSRAQGINVDFVKVLGLMLSNGLVALASALYCQYQGFADVNAGRGAIVIGLSAIDSSIQGQISEIQTQIDNPTLQNDLSIVTNRENMLAGFQSYNDNVGSTSQLFNYMPKVQTYIINKVSEPIESIVNNDVELDILNINISDYSVTVTFMGRSNGDPTPIPSQYVDKLTNEVKTKYGDPYFQNVNYSGFSKSNSSIENTYLDLSTGESKYDTVFTFTVNMNVRPGSDEDHATSIDLNPQPEENVEVTE